MMKARESYAFIPRISVPAKQPQWFNRTHGLRPVNEMAMYEFGRWTILSLSERRTTQRRVSPVNGHKLCYI